MTPGIQNREEPAARVGAWTWRQGLVFAASFALTFASLWFVWLLARPLVLLVVAIIIAQALAPVVNWLGRWLPRPLATALAYLVVFGVIAGGLGLLLPVLARQAEDLIVATPDYLERGRTLLDSIEGESGDRVIDAAQAALERFSDLLLDVPLTIFSSFIDLVLVIFMSIYWLMATPAMHRFAMSLVPPSGRDRAEDILREMGGRMGGFVRGQFIDVLIIGVIAFAGFSLIGLEYAVLLAVIQGFGEIVPIVGPIIAAVPAVLVGLLDSPQQALIVLVFVAVLQQMESNILVPLVMRNQADIPPLLSLLSIAAGGTLGGLLGALVAIPLGGALQVLVVRVVAPAIRRLTHINDGQTRIGARPPGDQG